MGHDWDSLKEDVKKYGTRNSLLTALMPTASTAQIMKNNEAFEPYSSNIYVRKTLAGEYIVVNEHLVKKLLDLGLWNKEMYEEILYYNGSVQKIKRIPEKVRSMFKTAFEMKQVAIVRQAVERGPFIDQTQSMNLFQSIPDFNKLSASHFYSWANGLKTGMYYLRTQPAVDPIKFGLDANRIQSIKNQDTEEEAELVCRRRPAGLEGEECIVCSS
jgi:ribonucleoside-diphosphate reductase alpha chain